MLNLRALRLYIAASAAMTIMFVAAPARAQGQFRPQPLSEPPAAETYVVEASAALWAPSADMSLASAGTGHLSGIAGTTIDFKTDLGLVDQHFGQLKFVLRPATRHKFRFEVIPISYNQTATLTRQVVFNGIRYNAGVPVASSLDWKAYRFAYEYDFLSHDRWYVGVVAEAKYTDVQANLTATLAGVNQNEFAHAKAPIPALGGIARFYIAPAISLTGEVTGFKLPNIQDKYEGHYADVDIYGTINANRFIGAQIGFRSLDVGYLAKTDTGAFTLRGLYFGAVVRY